MKIKINKKYTLDIEFLKGDWKGEVIRVKLGLFPTINYHTMKTYKSFLGINRITQIANKFEIKWCGFITEISFNKIYLVKPIEETLKDFNEFAKYTGFLPHK